MNRVTIYQGHVMEVSRGMAAESVQCVVTSPPYWGLRDYQLEPQVWGGEPGCQHLWEEKSRYWDNRAGSLMRDEGTADFSGKKDTRGHIKSSFCRLCGAWRGSFGLEPTIELYVEHTVAIFREVRRVLKSSGCLFLNLGDSYMANCSNQNPSTKQHQGTGFCGPNRTPQINLKPKDLCGVPWRLALALQADGWWLRSDIIWAKPNPMPESCTDRPTKAHEYIFLLTKSAHYYWDQEAVREVNSPGSIERFGITEQGQTAKWNTSNNKRDGRLDGTKSNEGFRDHVPHGRNLRTVWEIPTYALKEAHFATFPPEIPRRCIAAGTSEAGCCPKCRAAWKRVVEKVDSGKRQKMADGWDTGPGGHGTVHRDGREKGQTGIPVMQSTTTGWVPTCKCLDNEGMGIRFPFDPIPCTVLDPFSGAGTTGLVAAKMGRDAVLIELSPSYVEMSRKRITGEMGMLCNVEVVDAE